MRDNKSTHKPRDDFNPKVLIAESRGKVEDNITCHQYLRRGHFVTQCPNKRMVVLDNEDIIDLNINLNDVD